ncbi:hypothetical protein SLA2020_497780 [Shorea laevis]
MLLCTKWFDARICKHNQRMPYSRRLSLISQDKGPFLFSRGKSLCLGSLNTGVSHFGIRMVESGDTLTHFLFVGPERENLGWTRSSSFKDGNGVMDNGPL